MTTSPKGSADDLFLIGGDADPPLGAFSSAVEMLDVVAGHPQRPRAVGIAGYPEGHPAITEEALEQALAHKSRFADYVTTQAARALGSDRRRPVAVVSAQAAWDPCAAVQSIDSGQAL